MASPSDVDLSKLRIDRGDARDDARRGRAPKRGRGRRVPGLSLIVVLAILGGAGWLLWPRLAPKVEALRAPEVKTGTVVRFREGQENETTTATGYVVARTRAALAAEVSGRLVELKVDVGSRVNKDDVIARIDPGTWTHAVTQMKAMVAQQEATAAAARADIKTAEAAITRVTRAKAEADAALRETEADLVETRRVLKLEEDLDAKGSGIVDNLKKARNDVDRLTAARDRRRAALETLAAEISSAEAEVDAKKERSVAAEKAIEEARARLASAEVSLGYTEIRAPFSGVILRKEAELGEMVVPALAGGGTSRGSVVTMADFASLEMEVDVFERDIGLVQEGAPAEITVNAYTNVRFPAKVRQIVPTAERSKGTVVVKVAFEWKDGVPDPRILPEMGGKVTFLRDRPKAASAPEIRAPAAAVTKRGSSQGVFVLEADRVRFRIVEIGERRGDQVVILSGVNGGESVVLDPSSALDDGMTVRVASSAER